MATRKLWTTCVWASLVAQMVKSLPAVQASLGQEVPSLGQEDALEKEMATHSSILTWRSPWTEEPGGLRSMGLQGVRHGWASDTFTLSCVARMLVLLDSIDGGHLLAPWRCILFEPLPKAFWMIKSALQVDLLHFINPEILSWWWTGKPGVLQSMGSQRVGHDWATELNRTEMLSALDKVQLHRERFSLHREKTAAGSPSYHVFRAELPSQAHLSPPTHPVPLGRGQQGDCVLEGGFGVDRGSKGRQEEPRSQEASCLQTEHPEPRSPRSPVLPRILPPGEKSQLPHCLRSQ